MNLKYIITILFLVATIKINSQDIRLYNNFIILINNNIVVNSITSVKLSAEIVTEKKRSFEIKLGYVPGDLYYLSNEDKKLIDSDNVDSLILSFDNNTYLKQDHTISTYKIPLSKNWLGYSFIVLRIDDKKKSKTKYDTSKNDVKKYTYSFDFPSYSIINTEH